MVAHKLIGADGGEIPQPNDGFAAVRTFTPVMNMVAIRWFYVPRSKTGLMFPEKPEWQPENLRDNAGNVISLQGEVLACGPDCKEVKVGDVVLLQEGRAVTMVVRTLDKDGKTVQVVVCNEQHLLGVMDEGKFIRSGE